MPIYVYRCGCGVRFEQLTSFDAAAPVCPSCGGETRKIPAGFSLGGQADAGLGKDQMPQTWRGVYDGNREYTSRMRRQWENRQRLEAKYPEIAGDQRPILAHEGRYHDAPLRAGDPVLGERSSGAGSPGAGHGHGHGHGHPEGAASSQPSSSQPSSGSGPSSGSPPRSGGADSGPRAKPASPSGGAT
ncbi:MAG TPA: zinc ribbon domain-containing protein [Pseudonocardia sp.]|uniref:FmdB family zinc ribbon protein n=1 Tax=Pseudonocardia sp. TaxID=60912 RepID=UPI002BE553DE|nr:zinc ribbon domain-containing protein [Pseudonocardia sp.]HTF47530.1 zinc ribbon domain-containing protein [Pseudonocardia sp.]